MRFLMALVIILWAAHGQAATAPVTGLLVTTHPLYLIAKAVTQDIESPELLLSPNQTGHDVQLRPQDRQRVKNANLVLWFGQSYEAPLAKILKGQPNAMALFELKAFNRLPVRDVQGRAEANSLDPHIWLDPINAIAIAHAIAAVRAKQFPQHAAQYQQNAQQFSARLIATIKAQQQLAQPAPYWAFHDAYQYLEKRLKLQFKGSLTMSHDLPPTPNQLMWLAAQRKAGQSKSNHKAMCLLAEGHIDQAVIKHLQPLKLQAIDEVMLGQDDFVRAWANLATQIRQCTTGLD
jgi:zinc transport system substrate-binding protein